VDQSTCIFLYKKVVETNSIKISVNAFSVTPNYTSPANLSKKFEKKLLGSNGLTGGILWV
jgi:hypothetical protein